MTDALLAQALGAASRCTGPAAEFDRPFPAVRPYNPRATYHRGPNFHVVDLSQRAQKLTSSAIREILKVTERPEVISFAGGLPSPDTFPVERLRPRQPRC